MNLGPVTVTEARTVLKSVVEAHDTHNNWLSAWSVAKDEPSEKDYPIVVWDQWTSRLEEDQQGSLVRIINVKFMVVTSVATDRTQDQRDAACEAAEEAAKNFILSLRADHDWSISNVFITTQFDEGPALETGVLVSFTVTTGGLCLDDVFTPPTDPGTCDPFAININGTPYTDVVDPCGGSIDIAIYDSQGSVVPTTINLDDPEFPMVMVDDLPATVEPITVRIYVNGVLDQTIADVDPTVDNTITIHPTP